jgi:hypothetical protein
MHSWARLVSAAHLVLVVVALFCGASRAQTISVSDWSAAVSSGTVILTGDANVSGSILVRVRSEEYFFAVIADGSRSRLPR